MLSAKEWETSEMILMRSGGMNNFMNKTYHFEYVLPVFYSRPLSLTPTTTICYITRVLVGELRNTLPVWMYICKRMEQTVGKISGYE